MSNMKEGWEYKRFEDTLEKVKYTKKLQTNEFLSEGRVPIISQEEDYIRGFWNNPDDAYKVEKPIVIFGDHSRVIKYVDFDFVLGADGVKILKPIESLNAKFLYHYLKWYNVPNMGYSRHYKFLKEINMPVPPLKEQQQIVSELDLLSGVIEKQKAQLEELDKLAQSIFYDMFGKKDWESKKIKDIAIVKIGPFGSALHQHDYISGGTPLVNPIHMKNGKIEADFNFTISDEKKKELSSYLLKINDIVFGRRGDIGRCALVTQKENGFLCGTGSLFVRFTININPLYSLKILSSSSVKQYLLGNARGATMLNLNSTVIEGISIPLPPLSLQQEFAAKVEAIEAMKAKVRQSLKEAETLFNERMDYYFN